MAPNLNVSNQRGFAKLFIISELRHLLRHFKNLEVSRDSREYDSGVYLEVSGLINIPGPCKVNLRHVCSPFEAFSSFFPTSFFSFLKSFFYLVVTDMKFAPFAP